MREGLLAGGSMREVCTSGLTISLPLTGSPLREDGEERVCVCLCESVCVCVCVCR